jgi:hypothetical protein
MMYLTRRLSDDVSYSAGALNSASSASPDGTTLLQTPSVYNLSKQRSSVGNNSSDGSSAKKKLKFDTTSGSADSAAIVDLTGRYNAFKKEINGKKQLFCLFCYIVLLVGWFCYIVLL